MSSEEIYKLFFSCYLFLNKIIKILNILDSDFSEECIGYNMSVSFFFPMKPR